ncbi:MAG: DEAD/DEAH box helicase [Archaeoglobaceae archaeon]|nr:DEAD/DEAH box helicase [Archaeoglobaceae archaeon]MCX8151761.1 DEAD/DEAH box helicase [Archaeoglobaceae archaeon]MDW8014269.1 DEAD/DEAH box helicase [Archaeoglobaceae archaeon]
MDLNEIFCEKCGRIKRRCICEDGRREKNLKLLPAGKNYLLQIFNTNDEIIIYRAFEPYKDLPTEEIDFLPKKIVEMLERKGIRKLYPFQKEAMIELLNGKNVVITAPTGFGKTEAFAVPMMIKAAHGKAIVFYPTKALARDQELKLKDYGKNLGLEVVRFDGDSGFEERRKVFSLKADVILTNPDMVDYHLRKTPAFRKFASMVKFVAVDELQVYTGLLGANMYYLIKRLSRFSDFQIACSSATLSNAKEFAEELFEREFVHVSGEHRKGTLNFIMRCASNIYSSVKEIVEVLKGRNKILIFGNSYKSVETINWVLKRSGIRSAVHKAGLPKDVRESVEKSFRDGKIDVIVATSTLELGIDIGDVDVVVSELVPYSQFLQRVGRAGRRGQESIGIVLLREDDAISTFYKSNPEDYFKDEALAFVEKKNDEVAKFHYISMCLEKQAKVSEVDQSILKKLVLDGFLGVRGDYVFATEKGKLLLKNFNLRGIDESVKMYCEGKLVGERVLPIAIKELFPGSVIIHNGERYRCVSLDLKKLEAELKRVETGEEVTDPLYISVPRILSVEESSKDPIQTYYCSMEINLLVHGYVERNVFTKEKTAIKYIEEPLSYSFTTKGIIFSCPFPEKMDYEDFYAGSFHALEHVIIESSDILTGGGSKEMGGISTPDGDVFVYDSTRGGSGMSKLLFRKLRRAFEVAYEVLKNCGCKTVEGCPRCTFSYQCGNNNKPLNKFGALNIVEKVLKGEKRETNWKKYTEFIDFNYFPT